MGQGPALLLSHVLFGGFDTGIQIARTYIGDAYRFVVPSRFGYLGSALPRAATRQARPTHTPSSWTLSASSGR